jgi:hypothetical protein
MYKEGHYYLFGGQVVIEANLPEAHIQDFHWCVSNPIPGNFFSK